MEAWRDMEGDVWVCTCTRQKSAQIWDRLMMMMIAVMVCSILWWLPMPSSRMYSTVHVMKAQKKRMMTYLHHHRGHTHTAQSDP